ncbi:MAG: sodium-dependent transporter [Defluviitaleaceae bacterium]|nr:sodium-dependent transporter [Defluviitaleaceae bacterium]
MKNEREGFSSRLSFIIVSISCAIGLGNIWLMPYRAGTYGGALYIFLVALFIFMFAIPVLLVEYSVGRGSGQSGAKAFEVLTPNDKKWHLNGYLGIVGNYLLLMFYVMICGFALGYLWKGVTGSLIGLSPEQVGASWSGLTGDPVASFGLMFAIVALGMGACYLGLRKGVERVGKYMMAIFFALLIVLLIRSVTLPGAYEGLAFLFIPNLDAMREHGTFRIIHMAMGQSLFSLSVGIGSMTVFGSYVKRERRMFKDAFTVGALDLSIIILCLLMIFPAAFAFDIPRTAGEALLFLTLPNIFNAMPGSYIWALLFYIGLAFVAFSTAVAVMENLTAIGMDKFGWSRSKSALVNFILLIILCTPSAFTRNIWAGFVPPTFPHLGAFFTYLTMELALPIGALLYVLYCTRKNGWGWDNFIKEANAGSEGWVFPVSLRFYMTYIIPIAIIFILIFGQVQRWILTPMGILI